MKKALLILALLLIAPAAHASTPQVISGSMGMQSNTTQSWSQYIGSASGLARAASLPNVSTIASAAGTISGLVATSSNPLTSTQTMTVSFYKNGVQQALTCVINSSGSCVDNNAGHNFSVVAGDNLQASIVPANTPNVNLTMFYTFNFTPTTDNESLVPSANDSTAPSTTVTNYTMLGYGRPAWQTTEASSTGGNPQTIWPDAGTFSNFYYNNNATLAGAAKTIALTLMKNQTATAITATVDNTGTPSPGKTNDTTHTASVISGDFLDLQSVPSGTPSTQAHGAGFKFVSSTSGNFVTLGGNWLHNAGAAFVAFSGDVGSTTDAGVSTPSKPQTITSFTVLCASAAGAAKTSTFTLRQNGSNTALACTLSGATQRTCVATGSVAIADKDMLDYGFTGTGAATFCEINAVGNNAPAPPATGGACFLFALF